MSNEKEDETVTSASLISQHLNANLSNYILLILAVILIGVFSPTGLPRALLTGIVLYLYTFSIYCSSGIIKPLANFLTKAGKTKHIVTAASVFILINSISGISGQLTKNLVLNEIQNYWFPFLIVFIGGQIGNFLNLKIFPARILILVTAGLVMFIATRMGIKLFI